MNTIISHTTIICIGFLVPLCYFSHHFWCTSYFFVPDYQCRKSWRAIVNNLFKYMISQQLLIAQAHYPVYTNIQDIRNTSPRDSMNIFRDILIWEVLSLSQLDALNVPVFLRVILDGAIRAELAHLVIDQCSLTDMTRMNRGVNLPWQSSGYSS